MSTLFVDTRTLFGRYLVKLVRNPSLFVTNLATPVLLLALFSQMLGKLTFFPGVGASFAAYLTPGVVVMCTFMFSVQAGISIVNDLNSGFLAKILVSSADRGAILLGRLLTDSTMVVLASGGVLAVAYLLGVRVATGVPGILLILAASAFLGLTWAAVFLAVGMRTRSAETLSSFSTGVVFILFFLSSAMFPTSIMPEWAQTFSAWNPVSYVSNALRSVVETGYDWTALGQAFLISGALALLAFGAALAQFRRTVS